MDTIKVKQPKQGKVNIKIIFSDVSDIKIEDEYCANNSFDIESMPLDIQKNILLLDFSQIVSAEKHCSENLIVTIPRHNWRIEDTEDISKDSRLSIKNKGHLINLDITAKSVTLEGSFKNLSIWANKVHFIGVKIGTADIYGENLHVSFWSSFSTINNALYLHTSPKSSIDFSTHDQFKKIHRMDLAIEEKQQLKDLQEKFTPIN